MTAIEWTEATWNPTTGCDRISPGCDHCYALTMAKRLKAMGQPKYQNDGDPRTSGPGFRVTVHPGALDWPDGPRRGDAIRAGHDHSHLTTMYQLGKKAAGRLLDGRTWDEYPRPI